jgi:hypothetical protein
MLYRIIIVIIFLKMSQFNIVYCDFRIIEKGPEKVKGGYKECTLFKYDYKSGDVDLNSKTESFKYKYDENGYMIEEIFRNKFDSVYYKETFKYDEKGNKIEEVWYSSNDSAESKIFYFYDENGKLIEELYPNSYSSQIIIKHKYDNMGNEIALIRLNSEASIDLLDSNSYKYNEKGNKISKFRYISIYRIDSTIFYYDGNENLFEEVQYLDGSIFSKITYKYDEKGNKIEDESIFSDLGEIKTTSIYDEKGNLLEITNHDSTYIPYLKSIFKYDSIGNIIEKIEYGKELPYKKIEFIYSK